MIESNQTFIVAAFAVTWVAVLGYVLHLARRGALVMAEHERMLHESTRER